MTEGIDFGQKLNNCLDRLGAGERLEDCLASYPPDAEHLAPLLRTASMLQTPDGPNMSPGGFAAGEARLRARAAQLWHLWGIRQGSGSRTNASGLLAGARRLAVATVAGVLLLCMVLSAGTVSAASASMPGSPLYPVKRATEAFVSRVAPTPQLQAHAHLAWADRRLREIEHLVARDGVADEVLLAALEQETDMALGAAERAGIELLAAAVVRTEQQHLVLSRVLEKAPPAARPGLERALDASERGHARAQSALERATSPNPPITPPGQAGDRKPPHKKQETPPAQDASGTPPVSSEVTDELHLPRQGSGQGQGHRQDETEDTDRDHGYGYGQNKVEDPSHDQGQGQDKHRESNPGQGPGKELEKNEPGSPDESGGQGIGPSRGEGSERGNNDRKHEKSDNPGGSNDKSK